MTLGRAVRARSSQARNHAAGAWRAGRRPPVTGSAASSSVGGHEAPLSLWIADRSRSRPAAGRFVLAAARRDAGTHRCRPSRDAGIPARLGARGRPPRAPSSSPTRPADPSRSIDVCVRDARHQRPDHRGGMEHVRRRRGGHPIHASQGSRGRPTSPPPSTTAPPTAVATVWVVRDERGQSGCSSVATLGTDSRATLPGLLQSVGPPPLNGRMPFLAAHSEPGLVLVPRDADRRLASGFDFRDRA